MFSLEEACFAKYMIIHEKWNPRDQFAFDSVNGSMKTVPEQFCSVNVLIETVFSCLYW